MSTDVVKTGAAEVAESDPSELALIEQLARQFQDFFVEPEDLALSIAMRYAMGTTVEAILTPIESVGGKAIVGRPFVLYGLQVTRSSMDDGWGYFAMLHVADPSGGDPYIVTTGALNVVAQALALVRGGFCPIEVRIENAGRPTASGFMPQRLAYNAPEQAF